MTDNEKVDNLLAAAFKLPPKLSHLLRLLISVRVSNVGMIEKELGIGYDARILVHRLRKRMHEYDIVIHSQYGGQYWLTPEHKEKVRGMVHELV